MIKISNKRIGIISLGCDKNRVDTEKMLAKLKTRHVIVNDPLDAEIIVVNTCAFLNSARKEAIDEILYASTLKENGLEKLIVTGCLPQKFVEEIYPSLIEADIFLGTDDYDKILDAIDLSYENNARVNFVGQGCGAFDRNRVLTTANYAYLKIADGCSNHCTYCLIPSIRGKYRSYKKEDLIDEVKSLGDVNELILVAQDITKYGVDLYGKFCLVDLIKEISAIDTVKKIRLLYCYPENITKELINEIKTNDKVLKYIDIPLQHADDKILRLMNRKGTFDSNLKLIERLKREINGIAIRSTFITGFPGETDEAHERLKEFLLKAKLFNAGFFAYSKEEGTPSFKLPNHLPEKIKKQRLKDLYKTQKTVVKETLKGFKGQTLSVVAEEFNGFLYVGRAYFNAPDIDGKIYFFSEKEVVFGEEYQVKINKAQEYDLYGVRV